MRLESAMNASREGLKVHGQALAVTGDNISNVSTTSYKTSRTEFADLVREGFEGRESSVGDAGGAGVTVQTVRQIHTNGSIEPTGRELDVAITGNGYFMVGSVEDTRYTRAGNFEVRADGVLTTADGLPVLGFQGDATALGEINMQNLNLAGSPTTTVAMFGNIDASAAVTTVPQNPASFRELSAAATARADVEVYDSLGEVHGVSIYFFKTAANTWTAQAYIDGGETNGTENVPQALGQATQMQFGSDGLIAEAARAGTALTLAPAFNNGAAAGNITVNLGSFTQYAGSSQVAGVEKDGQSAGDIESYEFLADGTIQAVLSTGGRARVGALQLADFVNKDGLDRIGSSLYRARPEAGAPVVGAPGTGTVGGIEARALERSTVDISEQFVNLIVYQRGYQANSQMMSATTQLLRETIQLIR